MSSKPPKNIHKKKKKSKEAKSEPNKCDIDRLFQLNLPHIWARIFVSLSLDDLDNCKVVCKDMNRIMKTHVWGSEACMRILRPMWKETLAHNWEKVHDDITNDNMCPVVKYQKDIFKHPWHELISSYGQTLLHKFVLSSRLPCA